MRDEGEEGAGKVWRNKRVEELYKKGKTNLPLHPETPNKQ